MMKMSLTEAAREIKELHKMRRRVIAAYRRKRTWKPSEVAMAVAGEMRRLEALEHAYLQLTGKHMDSVGDTLT